jgi:MbtH protein
MHTKQDVIYNVVINLQDEYSIWPKFKDISLGWRMAGKTGTRQECLDYIADTYMESLAY